MLLFLSSTWLLFRAQLAGVIVAKRTRICLLLALLPIAFAAFAVTVAERVGAAPAREIGWLLQVQVLVPLLALVLGSSVVAGEVENRTVTYLFTRPIPRASVLLGGWLAVVLVLLSLQLTSAAVMLHTLRTGLWWGVGDELPDGVAAPLLVAVGFGTIVYSALFASLGTLVKHPMVIGLGYVFAFEVLLSNLPGSNQGLTIQYYLRSYVWQVGEETWRNMDVFQTLVYESASGAVWTLVVVTVISLLGGGWAVSRKQYVLPA